MLELEKDSVEYKQLEDKAGKLDVRQFLTKIFLNRIYGSFSNKHFSMFDPDISRSITLTGQAVIKQSAKLGLDWINNKAGLQNSDQKLTRVAASDTDSLYLTIKPIVKAHNLELVKNGKATKEFLNIADELEHHLNTEIKKWGQTNLNSKDCRFEFKREAICDVALFLQKKRYVLHILDLEGIPCDKFKYAGVEVVRSTLPKAIKPSIKKLIELMMVTKDIKQVTKLLNETYETFKSLPVIDIAYVSGVSNLEEFSSKCNDLKTVKRMPCHAKAAYYYNLFLDKNKLQNKYEKIVSGDKVRYFYIKQPNKYGCNAMGFKSYYPNEFGKVFEVDHELMFKKAIFSIMERFYEAVGWTLHDLGHQPKTDLFDLFK